jgi:hypothetical protein
MTPGDLGLHLLALLGYPGALLILALGVGAEAATTLALTGGGPRAALLAPALGLRRAAAGAPLPLLASALLAALAATQLAAPLNPVPPVERNLLVAAVALAAAAWLRGAPPDTAGGRRTLLAQVCWLVALLTPALLSQSLRPQALGAIVLPAALPLKASAGLLGLLCLPALLDVSAAAEEGRPGRLFLWLPACGLFASVFFPPGGDDLLGLLWFLALTAGAATATIGLAVAAARRPAIYPRLLAPLALAVLVIAALTSATT